MSKAVALSVILLLSLCNPSKVSNVFPPGIFLNNPGNIEHNKDDWLGAAKFQNNRRYVRFETPKYGLRALMKTLKTYEDVHGFHTLTSIIHRWAPPSENDTYSYVNDVSERMGIPPNILIDIHDIDVLIELAKAIVIHENGHPPETMPPEWYSEATYHAAAVMALEG